MLKNEYLIYSIKNENILDANWWFSIFSPLSKSIENSNHLKYDTNIFKVNIGNNWIPLQDIEDKDIGIPIYKFNEPIRVTKDIISNIKEELTSTVGRLLCNKILLEYPFRDKIPYINKQFTMEDIEKLLPTLLREDVISVGEYLEFTDAALFITGMSRVVNYTATYNIIVPPDNIEIYKKEVKESFDKKYGPDWVKDRGKCTMYQEEVKKLDKEWLSKDPASKGYLTKKIIDNSRVKTSLMFGAEVGFDKTGRNVTLVNNSLMDGLPKDKKQLAAIYNSSRAGSYDRGNETQKGGAAAKDILRSSSGIEIKDGDCGTSKGLKCIVTKDIAVSLNNRFIIDNGKLVQITDGNEYIGKEIEIRSPCYCKYPGTTYCSVCVGKTMAEYKTGTPLILLKISSKLLTLSLKAMHDTQVKIKDIANSYTLT